MVVLTIDGKQLEVPEGTTVLRAAQQAGIHVPTLCDHPELTPYGGCRLCLVEVEGARTLQPSCTLPASSGMVVHTSTDKVRTARKFVLTLLFSERNHFCPFCEVSGEDCDLQQAAYGEDMDHWPLQPNWEPQPVDASHPFILMDQNRCILCRRCVRACAELTGAFTLGFEERGARSALVADYGLPLGESTCLSCGMCVQVCPTGALVDKRSAYLGQKSVLEHNQTICLECSMGCGIDVLSRNDQVVRIEGNWEAPVNDGVLCVNGRYLSLDDNRDRLQSPLVRKDGQLVPASWDEALDAAAAGLKPLIGKNGSGVAAAASTRLTAESLYLFKELFAGKMGSALVTSTEQGAATAAAARLAESLGKPFEAKFDALKNADCIVLVGAELNEQNPVAGLITRRLRATGAKLVIIDQGDNSLSELADSALLVKEGSLSDLIAGLTAAVVKQGLSRLETALDGRKALSAATVKTGISADAFLTTARMIAGASQPVIVFGQNLAEPAVLLDLAAATSAGIVSLKGGANSLAASQLGLDQPFTVNGQQAVYLALGDEDPTESLVKSLAAAPFLVVQASHKSALTEKADVVLPVEAWVERQGSFFSADGRLQQAVSSVSLPEAARDSQAVLVELAARMDIPLDAGGWQEAFNRRISPVTIY